MPCVHCDEPFEQHTSHGDSSRCPDGEHTFNQALAPPCMHCGEPFEQHLIHGDRRCCRNGARTFNQALAPPCVHCGEPFEQHLIRGERRCCRNGERSFNHVFHINPDAIDFLIAHPDIPPRELAERWIQHVSRKP
jgi:hypothetical protein